jgi:uncharacterized protein (DUF2164 family)
MARENLVPISFYLPKELHDKLKVAGKNRKQSELIRNAIQMIIDGNGPYISGYNQGLKDAIKEVENHELVMGLSMNDWHIGEQLIDYIGRLEKSK